MSDLPSPRSMWEQRYSADSYIYGTEPNDFLRANSILHFSREGLMQLADDVQQLATKEGLTAHRGSVEIRTRD